jgi:hypothetical protein
LAVIALSFGVRDGLGLARLLVDHGADINPIRMMDEFSGNGCCTPLLLAALAVWDAMPGAQDLVNLLVSKEG